MFQSTNPGLKGQSGLSWIIATILVIGFGCCWVCLVVEVSYDYHQQSPLPLCCFGLFLNILFAFFVYFELQPILNNYIIENFGDDEGK